MAKNIKHNGKAFFMYIRGKEQVRTSVGPLRNSTGRVVRPRSHLLYGEDTAAVRPLNWQKRVAAAEKLRWPQGGPTPFGYILQAVGAPWNYSAEL